MKDRSILKKYPRLVFVAALPSMVGERDSLHQHTASLYLRQTPGNVLESLVRYRHVQVLYHDTAIVGTVQSTAQAIFDHLQLKSIPRWKYVFGSVPAPALGSEDAADRFVGEFRESCNSSSPNPVIIIVTTAQYMSTLLNIDPDIVIKPGAIISQDLWVNRSISED